MLSTTPRPNASASGWSNSKAAPARVALRRRRCGAGDCGCDHVWLRCDQELVRLRAKLEEAESEKARLAALEEELVQVYST